MPDLAKLEEQYREAQEAYSEDRTEENHEAYEKAKKKFAEARVAQRQVEEADPDHSRGGDSVAVIVDEKGDE